MTSKLKKIIVVEDEPDTSDIMWEGTIIPEGTDLWEEAGLIDAIDEDKYELQIKEEDQTWGFVGHFSTSEDLQWVLDERKREFTDEETAA